MPFLLELLPFPLTFSILFEHGGFDALESVFGRNNHCCWEFLKLMDFSPRADLLCICRTVQLLDHPAHALFLLNYPPDSSIPENIRAWRVAQRCCVGWSPDVASVVLAMRAFLSSTTGQHPSNNNIVFPWLSVDADLRTKRSAEEWKALGRQQTLNYRFNEWWWHGQREAFHLERAAAKSSMAVVIKERAKAEMERLHGALKRRQMIALREEKSRAAWVRAKRAEREAWIRENNNRGGSSGGNDRHGNNNNNKRQKKETVVVVVESSSAAVEKKTKKGGGEATTTTEPPPPPQPPLSSTTIVLTSEDKKKVAALAKAQFEHLHHSVLLKFKYTINKIPAQVLDAKISKIAKLVVALEMQNPLIKWNIRLFFHLAAEETGRSVWEMEFLMQRYWWRGAAVAVGLDGDGKPLEMLAKWGR